jgi:hypothetical protein
VPVSSGRTNPTTSSAAGNREVNAAIHRVGLPAPDRVRPISEQRGRRCSLTLSHRTDLLVLAHGEAKEKLVAASTAPVLLADQNLRDRHRVELPSVAENDLSSGQLASRNSALDRGASPSYVIGPL